MSRGVAVALAALLFGCGRPTPAPPTRTAAVAAVPTAVREQLLDGAVAVLDRLDQFEESAAYAQVFDRLNQWSHSRPVALAAAWSVDPLTATLPERLRPLASAERLGSSTFDVAGDVVALRDCRWLADIARQARTGIAPDDQLAAAIAIFQWTIRSLAPVSDPPTIPSDSNPGSRWMLPGEILLSGRASPPQRAWIFLELLRQAGLDGAMLATGDDPAGARPWVPAVISAGEAYLFEPGYGMPIPGPGGTGVATARQAAADPSVLAALSLPDRPYPVQAADAARLTVLVAADPWSLSRRMAEVEAGLGAGSEWRLALDASGLATRARAAVPAAAAAGLWTFPWETLTRRRDPGTTAALGRELAPLAVTFAQQRGDQRQGMRVTRPLLAARIREFRGDLDGPEGAKASYLMARPSRQAIAEAVAGVPPPQADAVRRLYEQMKEDATYWLGVLTLGEGEYEAAIDYLRRMTLESTPDSRWVDAARLNLAAALLGVGDTAAAAALLREDGSPQRYGSRLRAERLGRSAGGEN